MSDTVDSASPTSLIMNYLKSQGKLRGAGPSSADVRAVLEENARNPGMIPGLTNQAPPGPDPAATATSASSGNRNSSNGSSSALPVPPIPPPGGAPAGGGDPTTSAAPGSVGGDTGLGISLPAIAAAVLGGGSLGALARSRMGGAPPLPTPGGAVPPPVDPGAGVPGVADPAAGRVLQGFRDNPVSPQDIAMSRATEGAPVVPPGVAPVDPNLAARAPPPGPTMPVSGAEPPMMLSPAQREAIRARAPGMNTRPPPVRARVRLP